MCPPQTVWIPPWLSVLPVLWTRHVANAANQRGEELPRLYRQLLPDPIEPSEYGTAGRLGTRLGPACSLTTCPLVQAAEVVSMETRAACPRPSILPTTLHNCPVCGKSRRVWDPGWDGWYDQCLIAVLSLIPFQQTTKDQFLKVQFNTFLLGNDSDGCPDDYVEVNGQRSVQAPVLQFHH